MFTGIIEETGTVTGTKKGANASTLTISGAVIFDGLELGDSVSVDGVCLTVSGLSGKSFTADVMNETLNRSNIGGLSAGSKVNLERAMPADGRFGGHMVSGHIDGTGFIADIKKDGVAVLYRIEAPAKILKYIVEKGSIAIDGVSLTVTAVSDVDFGVSVIPHTVNVTTLSLKTVGDKVNLENDIVGKYVEKLLTTQRADGGKSNITMEFLTEFGYAGG